ncbi:Arm DNA-binding domain-containing protein, partial [Legionella feeleii]
MLTDLKIQRLKIESKTKRYADRDGLSLEVRASGKKVFLFRFQWNQKPQTITVGHYPSLSELLSILVYEQNIIKRPSSPIVQQPALR